MPIHDDVTKLIGNTPLVRLNRVTDGAPATVAAKLEFYNPANSVKDRIGVSIVDAAEASGELKPGGTIVEATSGNTGIALAMVGAARGYKVVLTMPESMSKERRALLRAFGAELVLTDPATGMKGAVARADEIAAERGGVLARQFANEANPEIHRRTTAEEIWKDTDGAVDIVVAGIGTGGTITGVGEVLKLARPGIKVIAGEPAVASLLAGKSFSPHKIQGWTPDFVPAVLNTKIVDQIVAIDDVTARDTAQRLAKEEGMLVGISAGATLAAGLKVAEQAPKGSVMLVMLPDTAERYLSTILFENVIEGSDDEWLAKQA